MDSLVPPLATAEDSDDTEPDPEIFGKSQRKYRDEIFQGRSPEDVPPITLGCFEEEIFASYTGPDTGLCLLQEDANKQNDNDTIEDVAGLKSWNIKDQKAYGICISLYDQHPINKKMSGDPIADAFAVVARKNNSIMLIADGVNWGEKSKLAARCALFGSMSYINRQIFVENNQPSSAQEALSILRKSVDEAHSEILQKNGGLTTLCACLVCPVFNSDQYAVCTVNVGDSYAFIFSRRYGIREVTVGSHDVSFERDIRDAQGAIGPVNGNEPELNNLTCAVSFANAGDVIFLTTDGISDNFDPVVTKVALPRRNSDPNLSLTRDTSPPVYAKPEMSPQERHVYSMKEMERIVHEYELMTEEDCSAQEVCGAMVQHVLTLTDSKRQVLENPALYARKKMSSTERKRRDSEIVEKMSKAPGKLDHASLVAYEVGIYGQEDIVEETCKQENNDINVQEKENNNPDPLSPNILSPVSDSTDQSDHSESKLRKSPMKLFFSKSRTSSSGSSPTSPFKMSRSAKTPTSLPVTPKKYFKKSHSESESPTTPVTPDPLFSPPNKSSSKRRGKRQLKAYKRTVSYESNV